MASDGGGPVPSLSLFFFASDHTGPPERVYDSIFQIVDVAERLGFEAVWLPERHFHAYGAPFPNPSVLAAAIASRTRAIRLRAGSVVVPLHDVLRIAEEWSMVDAISGGRVGVSLASGWNEADFVLARCAYADRREYTLGSIDPVRRLWRGEAITTDQGSGIRTFPRAVQPDLPLWLTATSNSTSFLDAATHGLGVLTAYLQQEPRQLAANIGAYRNGFRPAVAASGPHVTLMMHAHVDDTAAAAAGRAMPALRAYITQFLRLNERGLRASGHADEALTDEERADLADYSARKYIDERSLIGDADQVAARLRQLAATGVDEVACFVDFGLPTDLVLGSLRRLAEVREVIQLEVTGSHG